MTCSKFEPYTHACNYIYDRVDKLRMQCRKAKNTSTQIALAS